jgi:hypothetical protein
VRAQAVQSFPDPDSHGNFPPLSQQALGVSKQRSLTAQQACKHLGLSGGSATPAAPPAEARLRREGGAPARARIPDFPDPTGLGSQALRPGIDTNSQLFQTTVAACETQAQKEPGVP